jgi:transcriptional regulator with XRE-family HTH domain
VHYSREACKEKFTVVNFYSRLRGLIGDRPQKEVADACGISASTLSNYLNEEKGRLPNSDELHKLARHFGVSMDYLFTGETGGGAMVLSEGVPYSPKVHAREFRFECVEHLNEWLDDRQEEWHGWALVEIRKMFPLEKRRLPEGRTPERRVSSSLEEKAAVAGRVAAAKVLSERDVPGHPPRTPVREPSAGKS